MQIKIRPPAVAGSFYPADPLQLNQQIDQLLSSTRAGKQQSQPIKALIAPHAGYIYSGPVAAEAYARVRQQADKIQRVILLGPAHRVALRAIAAPSVDFFRTPLGDIPVDKKALSSIEPLPQVVISDLAHQQEHSLEVHLPFLQKVLKPFTLVPLVVGHVPAQQVAEVLQQLWDGEETLIVVSSDLSHFHQYNKANRLDTATTKAILQLSENIPPEQACGAFPVNGLTHLAKQKQLKAELIAQNNSGDTAGDKNRVVGYGAYQFTE